MAKVAEKLTGPLDTMVVRKSYVSGTVVVCRDHYSGRKQMPDSAPSIADVQDARRHGYCELCAMSDEVQS